MTTRGPAVLKNFDHLKNKEDFEHAKKQLNILKMCFGQNGALLEYV